MKRYGNLYSKIYDIENIRLAHANARKGKTYYSEVKLVDSNQEFYFNKIHLMLKDKTFINSEYEVFTRVFNKKEREIYKLPYFPDRIIHHCIMQILEPIWRKTLIRNTFSSIKGRGIYDGFKRLKKSLLDIENTQYCLKLDIKKFYPSINHTVLKNVIRKKIKCKDTLWLLDTIIDSVKGVPIGNYLSQYFGNLVLSKLDHLIKEKLKIKYYFRYCDDLVLLNKSKKLLHHVFNKIRIYCNKIHLSIKKNYQVFCVKDRGISFLGYRFFHRFILARKNIVNNFKRKIKSIIKTWTTLPNTKVINSLMSYYGWLKHGSCYNLMFKYMNTEIRNIMYIVCLFQKCKNPLRRIKI